MLATLAAVTWRWRVIGWLRALSPLLISAVALTGVAWWAARQEAPKLPTSARAIVLLFAALGVYALITALRGYRWHAILRVAGVEHERSDAYGLTVVSYMGNAVLPARGGEVLRVLLLADRSGNRRRDVLGSIIPERLVDLCALALLFSVLTLSARAEDELGRWPAIAAAAGVLLVGLGTVVYLKLRVAGRFERLAARIRPLTRASRIMLSRTGALLALLTVGVWFLESSVFFLVAIALDLEGVDVLGAALVVVAASFLAVIPAGPGYVGTFDAAVLFALGILGVGGSAATGALLTYRFVVFVPITVVGLGLLLTRYGGLGALRTRRSDDDDSGAADHEELLAEQSPRQRHVEVPAGQ